MDILNYDSFSYMCYNLNCKDILHLELVSNNYNNYINKYIKDRYKIDIINFKKNLYNFYNDIDILHNLLNSNKYIFHNISFYSKYININLFNNYIKYIKNNYNFKENFIKIFNIYYNFFTNIINNIHITYIFFFQINRTTTNNNIFYLFINIKNTFINFYKFILLYSYLKYFIYNNKYIKQ